MSGLSEFRRALTDEGRKDLADHIEHRLSRFHERIKAVLGIRNQSLVHNERALSREQVYEINGITPDQIRELIDAACAAINHVASELGISNTIFESDRHEAATVKML